MQLSPQEQKEIHETLDQFGLNEKDKTVYLALLGHSQTTVTPLARIVQYPTTTVQSVLVRLIDKGLVSATKKRSRHIYQALDPSVIKKILQRQIEEMNDVIPLLQKLHGGPSTSARLRVFYRERMADIFHEALACKDKNIYEIVAAKEFQDIIGEKFHFTRRRVKKNIHLKSLRVESREIKKYSTKTHKRELREAKFLPRELTFASQIMFWGDTVAFFSTKEDGLAWIVESVTIRDTVQQLFDLLWSVSRKMETLVEQKST